MANNRDIEVIVEPEIRKEFIKKFDCSELENVKSLLGTRPDFIGYYNKNNNKLVIGEITVSGYYGSKNGDFHIGATRKLSESFLKLFILKNRIDEINKQLNSEFEDIDIYFIYPEKSKFMTALGYRNKVFEIGALKKGSVNINQDIEKIIRKVIFKAKDEMNKRNI